MAVSKDPNLDTGKIAKQILNKSWTNLEQILNKRISKYWINEKIVNIELLLSKCWIIVE